MPKMKHHAAPQAEAQKAQDKIADGSVVCTTLSRSQDETEVIAQM